jgi:transposase
MPTIKYRVHLTPDERAMLEQIVTKGRHSSQKILNALILLNCDDGPYQTNRLTNEQIASILPVSMKKIDRVKRRCVENGVEAALEKQKAERTYTKKADGDLEAHLIATCCSSPPAGYARWSLRLLADKMVELQYADSISHETIRRVLKKTNYSLGERNSG